MEPRLRTDSGERLTDLRVAVTGGTTGLGLALVRELLGRGATVAFVARDRERRARGSANMWGRTASSAMWRPRTTLSHQSADR
jgi:NAD(P)-dependent dehydrogenase (short-subunit alcohol dehydrogenase family)